MGSSDSRSKLLEVVQSRGGLRPGVAEDVARSLGVAEAHVYGTASFYHLLNSPSVKVRVCMGLPCQLDGARTVLERAKAAGFPVEGTSCLAACDRPPAVLKARGILVEVTPEDIDAANGDWTLLEAADDDEALGWKGFVGPDTDLDRQAMQLTAPPDFGGQAFARAEQMGPEAVVKAVEASGLQGRGGAGFPAGFKWKAVRAQTAATKYVVLNADEGEPGTFKDRELLLRRPDLVIEGLAIAARTVGAQEIYLYLRGEFSSPWRATERAIAQFQRAGHFEDLKFHLHAGHGAYICGEETALLEALEGKRGMPRLKPPYPTEQGLWGKPTLIHNVETIACLPAIVRRGAPWFAGLGRTGPGSKLYCVSGHVLRPGIYELPLGVSLDELVAAAGGYIGDLQAFRRAAPVPAFCPHRSGAVPSISKAWPKRVRCSARRVSWSSTTPSTSRGPSGSSSAFLKWKAAGSAHRAASGPGLSARRSTTTKTAVTPRNATPGNGSRWRRRSRGR